jgi:lipopolysaccharide transport system permease protein
MISIAQTKPDTPNRPAGVIQQGIEDVWAGLAHWRLSYLIGSGEIRRRYARSKLGQFWVTLSTAFTIAALGYVWSALWRVEVGELMLFISVSLVFWQFISGVLSEAPMVFISSAPIMHNQGVEHSTFVYALIVKQTFMLLHNLPILVISIYLFGKLDNVSILDFALGLFLLIIFTTSLSYLIAIACLRFRDLTQVVQNSLLVIFFITPVLWKPELMSGDRASLLDYNPFAIFLGILQKAFIGGEATPYQWTAALCLTVGTTLIALPVIGWARRRLIYWV